MTKNKMKTYCTQQWPQYQLGDGEKWPENGSLKYNTLLQVMLFCEQQGKWDEVPYVDAFMTLRNDHETRKKCKLLNVHSSVDGIYIIEKEGNDNCKGCCVGCGQSNSRLDTHPEEDIHLLVSPAPSGASLEKYLTRSSPSGESEGAAGSTGSENFSPIAGRTRAQSAVIQAPLRQAVRGDGTVLIHVPFTTSDLLNWKPSEGSYRENPEKVCQLLKTIVLTHCLN